MVEDLGVAWFLLARSALRWSYSAGVPLILLHGSGDTWEGETAMFLYHGSFLSFSLTQLFSCLRYIPSQVKLQHLGQVQRPPPNIRVYGLNHQPGLFPHILPVIKKALLSLAQLASNFPFASKCRRNYAYNSERSSGSVRTLEDQATLHTDSANCSFYLIAWRGLYN